MQFCYQKETVCQTKVSDAISLKRQGELGISPVTMLAAGHKRSDSNDRNCQNEKAREGERTKEHVRDRLLAAKERLLRIRQRKKIRAADLHPLPSGLVPSRVLCQLKLLVVHRGQSQASRVAAGATVTPAAPLRTTPSSAAQNDLVPDVFDDRQPRWCRSSRRRSSRSRQRVTAKV